MARTHGLGTLFLQSFVRQEEKDFRSGAVEGPLFSKKNYKK
jgi:hypothetical protein